MAETIGVGASILALLNNGRIIYDGLKDIQNAPVAIDNVKLEVFHLHNYLLRLKHLVQMPSNPLSCFSEHSQAGLKTSLHCLKGVEEQLLGTLRTYLTEQSRMGTWVRQVKWVMGKDKDVEKLRSNLESHKTTLSATVSLLHSIAIGKVTTKQGELQTASDFAVEYGRSLPEKPNELKCDELPDLDEVKKILQVSNRDIADFDNDQEKDDFWKIQEYKQSLIEFVSSGRFEEAVGRFNTQAWPMNYQHPTPSPEGYHTPYMTQTWGSVESGVARSAGYTQVNNYVASGYHINQQLDSPPVTPPGGHYWEPPPQPVEFVRSPPEEFPYSTQIPSMAQPFHPQPHGPSYCPPLQHNEWGSRADTMYLNETHNINYYGNHTAPGWPPYAAAAPPPPTWDPNFHGQQPYTYYPQDPVHTYEQSGHHEWNGTSGNGYS